MKILIIGNGLLGTSLIKRLESENHTLMVFSRKYRGEIECEQKVGDIFNFDNFKSVFNWKPQIVINTAWITTPGIYRNDPSNHMYSQFTVDLANYLSHTDVEHIINFGTCAEYGPQSEPIEAGTTQLAPTTLYGEQKVAAYRGVELSLRGTEIRSTWARIFYPYGPGQDPHRLIPMLINAIRDSKEIKLNDTSSQYDWISARDVASAISWVIRTDLPAQIDVGTSVGYTNLQILETLYKMLLPQGGMASNLKHDFGLNEKLIVSKNSPLLKSGWVAQDSLESGLQLVLEA